MRRGKLDKAGQISVKVGRLIAEGRARLLASVNTHNTRDLWQSVTSNRNCSNSHDLAAFGPPFDDPNAINNFFANIAMDPNYNSQAVQAHIRSVDPLIIREFTPFEVYRSLYDVTRTSQGSDPFPYWIFKECAVQLYPIVTHLFNLTLKTAQIPATWKHSIITPKPKVNPPQSLNDLRPISVTPILSRVFERLFVKHHFYPSLPANILTDQFAFRPTGSTTAALIFDFHHITTLLSNNSYVRCLLVDFSKAFDTVPHSTLLDKLQNQGCPQYIINWLACYLTDRTQSLATPGGPSPPLPITRSIIQGSGIGPTSFIAYIADLKPLSPTNIYSKYADDLTILCPQSSFVTISDELQHVQSWAEANGLLINTSKTKEIVFRRPSVKHFANPPSLNCIEQVDCVKLLGVLFTDKLSFTPHIDAVLSTISQRFYLLSHLRRQGLNMHGLSIVFTALILSKILYACQSFSGHLNESDINRLQSCLNKAHRWGYTNTPIIITELFEQRNFKLFQQILKDSQHCLHQLIPAERAMHGRSLRLRGHPYQLPLIKFEMLKSAYINKCLFDFI
jgi:hypothetical protein